MVHDNSNVCCHIGFQKTAFFVGDLDADLESNYIAFHFTLRGNPVDRALKFSFRISIGRNGRRLTFNDLPDIGFIDGSFNIKRRKIGQGGQGGAAGNGRDAGRDDLTFFHFFFN